MNILGNPRIVAVNTSDRGGGAERIASLLHSHLGERGWDSRLLVGDKKTSIPGVLSFFDSPFIDYRPMTNGFAKLKNSIDRVFRHRMGWQDYVHPFSHRVHDITGKLPKIVHLHNLHGGYFDLRALPRLCEKFPVFVTLEDCWWFSGHCAYSGACDRWQTGCGSCPSLDVAPEPKRRDATAWNWREKRAIFQKCKFHVASPSQWLLDRAGDSIMSPAIVEGRVIPHGIDLDVFHPGSKSQARRSLGLRDDALIVTFSANMVRSSPYKDFELIQEAVRLLGGSEREILFLAVGEAGEEDVRGSSRIRPIAYLNEASEMADYYRASDLYLHAAKNEAFGLVVAEAMACGTPVVATAVDGIPEVLGECEGGIPVPAGDAPALADAVTFLISNPEKIRHMGVAASEHARRHFNLNTMIDRYEEWYREVIRK